MRRFLLLYPFVLGPMALLAFQAWRGASVEGEWRVASWKDLVEGQAKMIASEADAAVRGALAQAERSEVVAYVMEDGELVYDPALVKERASPGTPEERAWYLLSMRGGESFEAAGDHAAALDAYSFHLPRIRAPELRARLRLGAARAALHAGQEALARALLLRLFQEAEDAVTEEGYPVDLLAASMLLARWKDPRGDLRDRAIRRLAEKAPGLRTAILAHWVEALDAKSEWRGFHLAERRALEEAVAARPEVLASRNAAIAGPTAVFARDETIGDRRVRALRAARITLATPSYLARHVTVAWLEPGAKAPDENTITRDYGSIDGGAPLGTVGVSSYSLAAERRRQRSFFSGGRFFVLIWCALLAMGFADIYRQVRAERELARLRLRLLANVSHELKTPITSIRMFAEMLGSNGADPARAEGFARHILRESERLSRLVEDVLDTARPERAEEALHAEPVDIAALIRTMAEAFVERAREAGVEFLLEGADAAQGEAVVVTSGPAVERILSNLLDNALKYRRDEAARITLSLDRVGPGVRVAVRDNGPGIAWKDRALVFDEFYRARYDDYAVKGAGLGLAIARRLARKLGGDIRVDSKEGHGSTFTLRLPAKAPFAPGLAGAPGA